MRRHVHFLRVDEVDGTVGRCVAHKAGGGVDIERTAHDDEDIGTGGLFGGGLEIGHGFAEPHYPRAQQRTVAGTLAVVHGDALGRERFLIARVVGVGRGTHFHQFAVQVNDVRRTGTLVQVVHVLRHDRHVEMRFQLRKNAVRGIGLRGNQLSAQTVVKVGY